MASLYPELYQVALALLVEARERAGLSNEELAARFGQAKAFIESYEGGTRLLDPGEFIAVARAIGVDPYVLLQEAEQVSAPSK